MRKKTLQEIAMSYPKVIGPHGIGLSYEGMKMMKNDILHGELLEGELIPNVVYGNSKCPNCNSDNTEVIGGGYQDADASRNMSMIESEEMACNDCGYCWLN